MLDITHGTFEGPLDLLLQLIEKEELEISEVSLAQVTDDYILLLASLGEGHRVEELTDFLVIAAKLILIKSRSLLPKLENEKEEESEDLRRQLRLYQEFHRGAKMIESLYAAGYVSFPRPYIQSTRTQMFLPPTVLTGEMLATAYTELVSKRIAVPRLQGISFDERITIQDKMARIKDLLTSRMRFYFHHIVHHAASKTDVIVSFLALLELIKQRVVCVTQKKIFEEISVQPISHQRGQTLIELMAAVFVITIGLLGVLGLTTANVRSETTAVMRLTAFNLTREGVELARNIRDSNWLSAQAWDTGLTLATHCAIISTNNTADAFLQSFQDSSSCSSDLFDGAYQIFLDSGMYTQYSDLKTISRTATQTQYYRRILFDPICLNKTQSQLDAGDIGNITETIVTNGGCDISAQTFAGIQVTSETVYKIAGRVQSARIIERLTNWR